MALNRITAKLTDRHDTISLDDQRQQIFGPDLIQQISPSLGVVLLQPSLEYRACRSVKTRNGKRQSMEISRTNGASLIVFLMISGI